MTGPGADKGERRRIGLEPAGIASRRGSIVLVALFAAVAWSTACRQEPSPGDRPSSEGTRTAAPAGAVAFTDESEAAGLDFVHQSGACGQLYLAEMMGSGVALLDYDRDGDLDVYLVQGGILDPDADCRLGPPSPQGAKTFTDRLYRNDLEISAAGNRARFTDVTSDSGIEASGYGMGVTTGDFDNDGWFDLYVTNLGSNQLLKNNGDGTFSDVTSAAGVDDPRWSASAAFVDFDGDDWLDLYVTNYVDFSIAGRQNCRSLTGARDYCGPLAYRPLPDRFFRNRGDGTFDEDPWSATAAAEPGAGLGVASGDFDADGKLDLYVSNDGMPNFLWVTDRNGMPRNRGMLSGSALNREGQAEAGMGVAIADIDADGDEDVLVSHLALETNTLYRNLGEGVFEDESAAAGIGAASWSYTGFGTSWLDFDMDGWLDLVVVNGAVKIVTELVSAENPHPLRMKNQLFRGVDGKRFEDVSGSAGVAFSDLEVSRGVATGDIDNDGDPDIVMTNNGGPARLLINQLNRPKKNESSWIGLRLLDRTGRRVRLGTWVGIEGPDERRQFRRVRTDGSYMSASDPRVLFALRSSADPVAVVVRWLGSEGWERFEVPTGGYHDLIQGTGVMVDETK